MCIFGIIKDIIYIFDGKGTLLYNGTDKIDGFQINSGGGYYSLVPIKQNDSEYIYLIGFINNNHTINLSFYYYNNINKTNTIKEYSSNNMSDIDGKGLSCQLMNHLHNDIIICFLGISTSEEKKIINIWIEPSNYNIIENKTKEFIYDQRNEKNIIIKSAVSQDKKKSLIT